MTQKAEFTDPEIEQLSLKDSCTFALEEARTVVPGVQALFGFQFIAIFSERFADLASLEQCLHLFAVLLVAAACALVMGPAAFHRQVGQQEVSLRFLRVTSAMVQAALGSLMVAVALEVYVVSTLVVDSRWIPLLIGAAAAVPFLLAWFVFPMRSRARRAEGLTRGH
ncbi:MAG: hypothetical protein HYX47_09305 [Burkholderiales bacterium]|nr:hypothetical protein [Burkholderiales bacterium]